MQYHHIHGISIIAILTCVNDLFAIVECGYKTDQMVAYLNTTARFKYFQFGIEKCFKLHIGKNKDKYKCSDIYLDNWMTEEVEDKSSGEVKLEEKFYGKQQIKEKEDEKWLGSQISADGSNQKDIKIRCNKAIGINNKIKSMMDNIPFGIYEFQVGKVLIDSLLLGSILCNLEVSYNLTKSDILNLEKCHESALRNLLSLGKATPKPMLYFFTGSLPIRFQLMKRRLKYLHHILHQNKNLLLYTFFQRQFETHKKND